MDKRVVVKIEVEGEVVEESLPILVPDGYSFSYSIKIESTSGDPTAYVPLSP